MTQSTENQNTDQNPRTTDGHDKPQREDQPLKQINDDPDDAENGTTKCVHRKNAQGDHAGKGHDPQDFDPINPAAD
jgi:hypothetical protein